MSLKYTAADAVSVTLPFSGSTLGVLADSAFALSDIVDNSAANLRFPLTNFYFYTGSPVTMSGTPKVKFYMVPVWSDGSTFPDVINDISIREEYLIKELLFEAGSNNGLSTLAGITVPSIAYKLGVYNETGVAFSATASVLYRKYTLEDA